MLCLLKVSTKKILLLSYVAEENDVLMNTMIAINNIIMEQSALLYFIKCKSVQTNSQYQYKNSLWTYMVTLKSLFIFQKRPLILHAGLH